MTWVWAALNQGGARVGKELRCHTDDFWDPSCFRRRLGAMTPYKQVLALVFKVCIEKIVENQKLRLW